MGVVHGRITKTSVDRLKPGQTLRDTEVVSFGVRARAKARSYFIHKKVKGTDEWITIGRHGAPWTAETARKEAGRLLGEIAHGARPAEARAIPCRPRARSTSGSVPRSTSLGPSALWMRSFKSAKSPLRVSVDGGVTACRASLSSSSALIRVTCSKACLIESVKVLKKLHNHINHSSKDT